MRYRWSAAWVGAAIAATALVGVAGCARPARPNQVIPLDLGGPRLIKNNHGLRSGIDGGKHKNEIL